MSNDAIFFLAELGESAPAREKLLPRRDDTSSRRRFRRRGVRHDGTGEFTHALMVAALFSVRAKKKGCFAAVGRVQPIRAKPDLLVDS
jgi:hypothetical protein